MILTTFVTIEYVNLRRKKPIKKIYESLHIKKQQH